ncbi:MAG: hypothetical protein K0Q55_1416, partial [Verrucomicrobia bacterium]|nr:hypothetical protein [Verrucomicrobiota bacterium]
MRRLQSLIVWLTLVFILWNAWYYLWFNHGWPGATRILTRLRNADGEAAYDAMSDEMLLI